MFNKGDKYVVRIIMNSGYKVKVEYCEKFILDICNDFELSLKNFVKDFNISVIVGFIIVLLVIIIILIILILIIKFIVGVLFEGINYVIKIFNNLFSGNFKYDNFYELEDEMGKMIWNLNLIIDGLSNYIKDILSILKELFYGNLKIKIIIDYKGEFL